MNEDRFNACCDGCYYGTGCEKSEMTESGGERRVKSSTCSTTTKTKNAASKEQMEYERLIEELDKLHELRRQMSHASVYHGVYERQCIEINKRLEKLTGFSYIDHKTRQMRTNDR